MTPEELHTRRIFEALEVGQLLEVDHEIKVGNKRWRKSTVGTVVSKERRLQGEHFRRSGDDKVWTDRVVLALPSGELTTVTIDAYTRLRVTSPAAR